MGSDIVVVERNRRRAFALLWAVPAWLRSIAVGARTLLDAKETAAVGARNAPDRTGRLGQDASFRIPTSSVATLSVPTLSVPTLSRNAEGQHACTGCQRCVEICPSRCLEVEGVSHAVGGDGVERFVLDLGRCIGCGDCVAVCPESALHAESLGSDFYAVASEDTRLRRDLLTKGATS